MNDIYEAIIWFLCIVGGTTIFIIGWFSTMWLVDVIHDHIMVVWKRKPKLKHRSDKPSTAKCYCVDCSFHDHETGKCYLISSELEELEELSYYTSDISFCSRAVPRTYDT